ncbi:MAG: hypothetical protein KF708_09185 [Pirellulales bacterium]|nr:hypothetical protein [Pirellulales bacterium]
MEKIMVTGGEVARRTAVGGPSRSPNAEPPVLDRLDSSNYSSIASMPISGNIACGHERCTPCTKSRVTPDAARRSFSPTAVQPLVEQRVPFYTPKVQNRHSAILERCTNAARKIHATWDKPAP